LLPKDTFVLSVLNSAARLIVRNCNRKIEISTEPTKLSRGNQLIHRCLSKTKSTGRGSRSRESGRQTVRRLVCMVFLI